MPTALTTTHTTSNTDDTVNVTPGVNVFDGSRAFISPTELQKVFDDLVSRPTDPIGKVSNYPIAFYYH